ncbi:class I SAM-dependent methyltransferase [Streptomyces sp. LP05-1]|uniref:Class I SAM-dependent methyltransferase n=1 Tax=Streptomyces pyxinae TaxID=2970734 RepID=A0ABT2CHZ5_9ACTN|nr:class I SAM-dependent methyltransferase [Streptomyces sp. LP05-1]MCS0636930.1 class I SAM-dependent methyltransferase [Streptomyces sp. LP05-1]
MNPEAWEALLYDWHNEHRLRNQRSDIAYWHGLTEPHDRILVLGAGTGRVAAPLADRAGRRVTALDLSPERLARMPRGPGLLPVCGDMRRLPLTTRQDAVVIPYSAFQLLPTAGDRERTLTEAARVLEPGGSVHIDVSGSFDTRAESDWRLSLAEPCPALDGGRVEEWERLRPKSDHVLIDKVFRTGSKVLARVTERWAHLGALGLEAALDRAGFELAGVDRGYGAGVSPHRTIYHGRRSG